MDLPKTDSGNKHVIVFRDFLTKFPLVFATPDQKTICIARLLAEEVIPLFGVPEALLSDRGTNLLSFLVKDLCNMLGIRKHHTTRNAMAWWSGLTARSRLCYGSMLPGLVTNETSTCREYSGHTETFHMMQPRRNPHIFSMGLISGHPQSLPFCQPLHLNLPM